MKNLFYFIISICTLYACSSDSDFNPEDENPTSSDFYELKAIPDKKVIFKAYPANMKQILGAGYDVTADHLSPEAIKAPIIDLEKLENSDEDYIYRMKATSSEPRDYAGENATTFLTDITNSLILGDINSRNALSVGTILKHKEFESDYNHSSQYSFASSEQLFTAERWYFSFFYTLEKYKYRYLTQEFENDVIVTADDDALYPENWLEGLWDTHEKYPGCVCCYRAHKITFEGGRVAPYQEWYGLSPDKKGPSEALFPVGVGGCCILQAISAASSSTAGRL